MRAPALIYQAGRGKLGVSKCGGKIFEGEMGSRGEADMSGPWVAGCAIMVILVMMVIMIMAIQRCGGLGSWDGGPAGAQHGLGEGARRGSVHIFGNIVLGGFVAVHIFMLFWGGGGSCINLAIGFTRWGGGFSGFGGSCPFSILSI